MLAPCTSAEILYGLERDETRLLVEANKNAMIVEVRPLGGKGGEAARLRAAGLVTAALERAGADTVPANALVDWVPRTGPPAVLM